MVGTPPGPKPDRRSPPKAGGEFFTFLQSLKSRFDDGDGSGSALLDEELLEFAIDDDEFSEPIATAAPAAADAPVQEPVPDLPLELAPPLPRWRRLLGEIAFGYAAIALIEMTLGRGLGSVGLHPHPYWLVVLPLAGARGMVAGLCAAAVGALLYFVGALQQFAGGGDGSLLDVLTYQIGLEPLGFFLAAFLVGDLRDRAESRAASLWRALMHSASERARVIARAQKLHASNRDLKVRLLDHSAQFGHLLDAARRLETAGRRELLEVALDMVVEHCRGERASAFAFEGKAPHVLAMKGWGTAEVDLLMQQAGMAESVQRAWEHGERYDAFAPGQVPLQHGPLLIAPICRDDGSVDCLLCLDTMLPEQYGKGLASIFFGIAEWVQIGLQRIARGDTLPPRPDVHETVANGWVGDPIDLSTRLLVEQVRTSRLRVRTSLLALHAVGAAGIAERDRSRFEHLLEATMLNGLLRTSDTLYRTAHPGTWLVVLPATPEESAAVVKSRIETFLGAMRFGGLRQFRLQVFAPQKAGAPFAPVLADIAAWLGRETGVEVDLGLPAAPRQHALDDAIGLAKRLCIEAHLSRRWVSDLYAVHLRFEAVRVDDPQALPQIVTEIAARFLDEAASAHEIEAGSYVFLLPFVNGHAAFQLGREAARALGTRCGGPAGPLPVEFEVLALAGRPDEGHFLLDRLLHHASEAHRPSRVVEAAS